LKERLKQIFNQLINSQQPQKLGIMEQAALSMGLSLFQVWFDALPEEKIPDFLETARKYIHYIETGEL
jgi:hypothetical protein